MHQENRGILRIQELWNFPLETSRGVPYFDIGGTALIGAQPADTIRQIIIETAARLGSRPVA